MSFSERIGIFADRGDGGKGEVGQHAWSDALDRRPRFVMPMSESRMRLTTHDGYQTKSRVIASTPEPEASLRTLSPTFRA